MKFLELHIFAFLFSKLRIYREKVQNKLSFAAQSRGSDEMEVGSVQLPRKVLLLRAARLLFVEKLDELNCRAEESSSSLSHHLLVVSSPRLNHPTSKLKRNSHHYCLFSSSQLIFSQAIIWLSPMDCPMGLGFGSCRWSCLCTYLGFSVGERPKGTEMDWTFTKSEPKQGIWKTAETIFEDQEPKGLTQHQPQTQEFPQKQHSWLSRGKGGRIQGPGKASFNYHCWRIDCPSSKGHKRLKKPRKLHQ